MKKYISIGFLLLMLAACLFFLMQQFNENVENNIIENFSSFDISESKEEMQDMSLDVNNETMNLDMSLDVNDEEKDTIQSECTTISKLYLEIYQQAEKVPSQYLGESEDITQETIDKIENILILAGYSVINSDSIYPDYLENSDCFKNFWESVKQKTDAEVSFWGVSSSGGLYYRMFQFIEGKSYGIYASANWNEDEKMKLSYAHKREILYWDMTDDMNFIYQDEHLDRHWEAAHLLRLHSVDQTMYDLTMKYILPIGYHNVNLFLLDWESGDYGNLCFNDLLDYLYRVKTNDFFMPEIILYVLRPIHIELFLRNFLRILSFRILIFQ